MKPLITWLQRLPSQLLAALLWRSPASRPAGAPPPTAWRPLTRQPDAPGRRYLVRFVPSSPLVTLDIHDLRTSLLWRCRFRSQRERNAYLQALRHGDSGFWPSSLLASAATGAGRAPR